MQDSVVRYRRMLSCDTVTVRALHLFTMHHGDLIPVLLAVEE